MPPSREFALVQATLLGIEVPEYWTTADICRAIGDYHQTRANRLAVQERRARSDLSRLRKAIRVVRARRVPVIRRACSWSRPRRTVRRTARRARSPGRRPRPSDGDDPDHVARVHRARSTLLGAARSGAFTVGDLLDVAAFEFDEDEREHLAGILQPDLIEVLLWGAV